MSTELLREVISLLISESSKDEGKAEDRDPKPKTSNLMLEPDYTKPADVRSQAETDETDEASGAAAAGGGPNMPMGVGPHYPGPDRGAAGRISKQISVVGRAFGNAKPINKNKRNKN